MGMPEIRIKFIEITRRAIEEAGRGAVLLLLKDNTNKGLTEINSFDEIPESFKGKSKTIIDHVFWGNVQDIREGTSLRTVSYRPAKVYVYCLGSDENLEDALKKLEGLEFNFMAYPDAEDVDNNKLISFIKKIKESGVEATVIVSSKKIKADSEDVVNFVEEDFKVGGQVTKANSYTGRIAGLIAGTPYSQSITLASLNEIESIADKEINAINAAIDSGNLTLCWKKGKARIARGVNSRTTITEDRGEQFKKIKLVNTYKFINNAIYKVIIDHYIGKVPNSYDNKCLLIVEIKNFLNNLSSEELIEKKFNVGINMTKQKEYLKSKGVDVSALSEQELKEADTGSKVFLALTIKGIDAMEDFDIEVSV